MKDEMSGPCSTKGRGEKCTYVNPKRKRNLIDIRVGQHINIFLKEES
jgi:hypothetical protein